MSHSKPLDLTNNVGSASATTSADEHSLISAQFTYTDTTPAAKSYVSGVKEVTSITTPAATSITSGQYFRITSPITSYYVWYNKDAAGGDPLVSGATGIAVAILAADTDANVATKTAAALDALVDFVAPAPAAAVISVTNNDAGAVTDAANVNVGGTFAISVTTQGVTSNVSIINDTATIASHGFVTGLKGQLTTTGTLPGGLSLTTDYFIISIDVNTVKFANSYANAIAGIAIDITSDGSGTHTFTSTALSATVKLQSSVSGDNWFDITGKSTTITASGSVIHTLTDFAEPMIRTVVTQTAGAMNLKVAVFGKK